VTGVGIDDPDVNFYENYACSSDRNYTRYCNPEIEKLFDQQSAMSDQAQRRQLVWQIDRQLQEDGARPIIFHSRDATCWQPYVRGIAIALNTIYNHWRFEDVWLDR
jgi:peptide/nickel transport system substrate-binding protein